MEGNNTCVDYTATHVLLSLMTGMEIERWLKAQGCTAIKKALGLK